MCDNFWQNNFYHQYMQYHAAMTQWLQHLHNSASAHDMSHMPMTHNVYNTPQYTAHCPKAVHYAPEPRAYSSSHNSISVSSQNYSSYETDSSDDSEIKEQDEYENCEDEESDESEECEYEFNVDAILAMRKAKEELKDCSTKENSTSDSSSIVMIDNVHEEFEIIELGSMQERESKRSLMVGNNRDRRAVLKCEEEVYKNLYGDKSKTIAGLETAVSVSYEGFCDNHQPAVWPVYPLRLKSCI